MEKLVHKEINVLDRIMWLLEEDSVTHVAKSDQEFARFIDTLYNQVGSRMAALRTA